VHGNALWVVSDMVARPVLALWGGARGYSGASGGVARCPPWPPESPQPLMPSLIDRKV